MCSLLRKKYQKSKRKKKRLDKKIKEKIVKENRRYRKGAHKEHSIALLFVVSFALFISVATFNTCFLSSLFSLLFITTGDRNTYRPATRTSAMDIYSILLSITDLCATYIYLFFFVPPKLHIYFRSVQKKTLAILVSHPHRYHVPATGCTVHCFALVRTLVRPW